MTGAPALLQQPSLSVIVNNYNHERFLGEAIDSVLALQMPLAEIVVVDDGSTDGSRDVIARYGERVTPLLQANTGQLQACLNALRLTTGDYIYFLDADDRVRPAFARAIARALVARPAKVQFRLTSVGQDGEPLDSVFPAYVAGYSTVRMLRDIEVWGLYVCPPTSGNVFRRDVMARVAAVAGQIDYETAIDGIALYLAPTMGEIVTVDESLADYRLHGANLHQQHVLSAPRLRKEIARTTGRWAHFAALTGRPNPFESGGPPAMVREWLMICALAEGRRPRLADAFAFLRGLSSAGQRLKVKLALTVWAAAVTVLPVGLAQTACAWRLSPLNRPRWLNRRIAGRMVRAGTT